MIYYLELRASVLNEISLLDCSNQLQTMVLQFSLPVQLVYKLLNKLEQMRNLFVSMHAAESMEESMLRVRCKSLKNYFKIGYSQSAFQFNVHTSFEWYFTAQNYSAKHSDNSPPMYLFQHTEKKYPFDFNKVFNR